MDEKLVRNRAIEMTPNGLLVGGVEIGASSHEPRQIDRDNILACALLPPQHNGRSRFFPGPLNHMGHPPNEPIVLQLVAIADHFEKMI